MTASSPITITNTGTEYEATRDGMSLGFLKYAHREGYIDAYQTLVDPALRGHGIAGQLVQALVDDAIADQVRILPTCSYVDHWLRERPEIEVQVRAQ